MPELPAGPLVDALGLVVDLEEHQRLTEAVLIGKVIDLSDPDHDRASLIIGRSGIDWISQRGLLSAAQHVLDSADFEDDDTE